MAIDITLKDLAVGYKGRTLIEGADATFAAGTLTALVGRNGSGKSTLLRVMAGLARPLAGEVFFEDRLASQAAGRPRGGAGGDLKDLPPRRPQGAAPLLPEGGEFSPRRGEKSYHPALRAPLLPEGGESPAARGRCR
jgi:energy-coupling factor transporter ATP-binding protein EcfA2